MKKFLKRFFCFTIFIIVISISTNIKASNEIVRINMKNKDIYYETVKQLGNFIFYTDEKNLTIDILKTSLEKIKELSFYSNSIKENADIQGIERFTNLEKLEICNYELEDITPISGLHKLKSLKICNCQISEIEPIKELKNLTTLDLAQNQISDITVIKDLTKIEKLNLSQNQIYDIKPLENLTKLSGLDLSSNNIKDISSLKKLTELTSIEKTYSTSIVPINLIKLLNFEYLYLDENQIEDISSINKEVLKYTSAQKQYITIKTKKKEINLPKAFLPTQKVELTNCKFNETKSKIIIDETKKDISIVIKEGQLNESQIKIEYDIKGPNVTISYDNSQEDNLTSTVIVTADEEIKPIEGWEFSEDKKKITKTFSKNGKEKIKIYDTLGNYTKANINVKNINLPIIDVNYSIMDNVSVSKGEEIIAEADKYIGTPYVLGGDSLTDGIDCSHFVWRILKDCGLYYGKYIRSTQWINEGEPVEDLEHAIAGDVIVWDGHVAFYDGQGYIVEAKGEKWGLTHDRLASNAIEKDTYMGIRRFTGSKQVETIIEKGQTTNKDIKVTINSSKPIKEINNWKISNNNKTLTKTYKSATNETVTIKDYDGNEVNINVVANINK